MLKQMPVDDVNFPPIYNNIGKTYVSLCQYQLALKYFEKSLKIQLEKFPSPSESTALTYKSIAIIYKHLGKLDEAKTNFEKAAEMYRQIHAPTYETVLEIEKLSQNLSSASAEQKPKTLIRPKFHDSELQKHIDALYFDPVIIIPKTITSLRQK